MKPLHCENPAEYYFGFVHCAEAHQNNIPGVGSFGLNLQDVDAAFEQGLECGEDLDFDASECWLAEG